MPIKQKQSQVSNSAKAFFLAVISSFAIVVSNGTYVFDSEATEKVNNAVSRVLWQIMQSMESADYGTLLFVVLAFIAFNRLLPRVDRRMAGYGALFAVFSSICILLADSYQKTDSWDNVFGSGMALATSLLRGAGLSVLMFFAYDIINRISVKEKTPVTKKLNRKRFLKYVLIMLLCWLPYIIIMAPGSMGSDTLDQFGQILNRPDMCWTVDSVVREKTDIMLTNHHPVFHTLLLGAFLKLGELIGSYFAGIYLFTILQSIAFSSTIVYCIFKMGRYGASDSFRKIVFLIFSLCPIFPLWAVTIFKDTLFIIVLLLTVILLYDAFKQPDDFDRKKYFALLGVTLLLMLIRNNGFYIILLLLPFVIIHFRKDKKFLLIIVSVLIIPLILFKGAYCGLLFNALGINEGSPREMLSVPFLQTARYISEYEDEITPEEEQSILQILGGGELSLSEIADLYVPDRSDSVKGKYNKYADTQDLLNYFKTWAVQFTKHPDVYVQAFLNLNYPWVIFDSRLFYYYGVIDENIPEKLEGVDNLKIFDSARSVLFQLCAFIYRIPVVSAVFEFSTYTYIYIIIFIAMLVRKRHRAMLACLPIFINYGICFIGPVAYMRYAIPMIVCLPFVFFITFSKRRTKTNEIKAKENEIWIK